MYSSGAKMEVAFCGAAISHQPTLRISTSYSAKPASSVTPMLLRAPLLMANSPLLTMRGA